MKFVVLVLFAWLAGISVGSAAPIAQMPAAAPLIQVDWQDPHSLPRFLRNHCAYDRLSGRTYCSNHCGYEYQVYYCAPRSFGCCRIGFGYCDWNGQLRCAP